MLRFSEKAWNVRKWTYLAFCVIGKYQLQLSHFQQLPKTHFSVYERCGHSNQKVRKLIPTLLKLKLVFWEVERFTGEA